MYLSPNYHAVKNVYRDYRQLNQAKTRSAQDCNLFILLQKQTPREDFLGYIKTFS